MPGGQKETGDKQSKKEKGKAAEAAGDSLVAEIEERLISGMQNALPSLPSDAVDETLKVFWNTDEEVSANAKVVYQAVDRIMDKLRVVNPGLAKIIDEFDSEPPQERSAAYLTAMIFTALTHDSTSGSNT